MGLLSAGGRYPQAEKSRDLGARLPPQVYDAAERDSDNDKVQLKVICTKIRPNENLWITNTYRGIW